MSLETGSNTLVLKGLTNSKLGPPPARSSGGRSPGKALAGLAPPLWRAIQSREVRTIFAQHEPEAD